MKNQKLNLNENFTKYADEYTYLTETFPYSECREIKNRVKILREWLDNEIDKYKQLK